MTGTATKPDPKADSADAKRPTPGLYVVVYEQAGGGQSVELLSEDQAAARVGALTYGSKQHRKELEADDQELPEGGGSHEINRKDIHVYRLSTSEVTDF
jgi:hypothetical protein